MLMGTKMLCQQHSLNANNQQKKYIFVKNFMTQTSATSDFATHEIQILNLHKIDLIALSFSKNNHYYFY